MWVPPAATQGSNLPVKVWLYGGGDTAGGISDPSYNGCNLAAENAVIVSINYRLGPLGFFALDSAGFQGNQAIQDMLMGLQWVQDNIGAFGGDAKQVLLFGQSAGAENAFIISTLPQAPKLIKAAILESGGGRTAALAAPVQTFGARYADLLKCSGHDAVCLRSIPVSILNSTLPPSTAIGIDGSPVDSFVPYVDGTIIPAQPSTAGVQVPTMFGSTTEEGTLFILGAFGQRFANLTDTDYLEFLSSQFAPSIVPLIAKQYPISAFNMTLYPAFFALANIVTDAAYKCSSYRGLKTATAKGVPVYTYLNAHAPSCEWIPGIPAESLKLLGATHSAELPLVFGRVTGLSDGTCNLTAKEGQLSKQLIQSWTAMASKANPSSGGLQWPLFSAGTSAGVMINETAEAALVDYSVCDFWDKIDALSVQLGFQVGAGNFSANATTKSGSTGLATGTAGVAASTSNPSAFTSAATRQMVTRVLSLAGIFVAAIDIFALR